MQYHEEFDVYYQGHGDPYVFTEQRRDYGKIIDRACGANVLDFGAHCGFFNVFVSRATVPANIVSVEPDIRLHPMLKKNCMFGTDIIMAAVVDQSCDDLTLPLHLGKTFAATNSLEHFRGREIVQVPTIKFQDLLEDHKITFMKCDCEGGEYGLDWCHIPDIVHTIAIEYHFHRQWWEEQFIFIDQQLLEQGFTHVRMPKVNTFQKISVGLYVRS